MGPRNKKPRFCEQNRGFSLGADDRARTGDLDLGKVALYQLSYVREELPL